MEKKERIIWIDVIKIIACIMVIILHTITNGLSQNNYQRGLWVYYIGTFAIPLFFMVNGYLMLGKEKYAQYNKYLLKKIFNILVVVFFWSFGIYFLKILFHKNMNHIIYETFGSLLQFGTFSHFWFLGSLIIIYSILPIINKFYKSIYLKNILICMIMLNVIIDLSVIFLYKKFDFILKDNIIQTFRIWIWLLYYVMGGILKKTMLI